MNFKPVFQSNKLDIIAILFAKKVMSGQNLFVVCHKLREELIKLFNDGFEIKYEGETKKVYARVIAVCGDNEFFNQFYGLTSTFQ